MDCFICYDKPHNVLIRPCNHGGCCEECMLTYLESNDSCPYCKLTIKKVYVMDYDEAVSYTHLTLPTKA